jgi:hypothetical protein
MNSEKISDWSATVSNLAVIVGIVFLVVEVNQSTDATAAAASDSVTSGYGEISLPIIENPQVARAFALGLFEPRLLTDEEAVQFSMYLRQLVNQHIRIMELTNRGLFSETFDGGDIQQLARILSTPGGMIFFEGNKTIMPKELLADLEPYLGQELQSDFTLGRIWHTELAMPTLNRH